MLKQYMLIMMMVQLVMKFYIQYKTDYLKNAHCHAMMELRIIVTQFVRHVRIMRMEKVNVYLIH